MKEIFTNELGNEITIQIDKLPEDMVYIAMYGPNSSVTNLITRKEAIVLRDMLENTQF